jgi:hypothetical protein
MQSKIENNYKKFSGFLSSVHTTLTHIKSQWPCGVLRSPPRTPNTLVLPVQSMVLKVVLVLVLVSVRVRVRVRVRMLGLGLRLRLRLGWVLMLVLTLPDKVWEQMQATEHAGEGGAVERDLWGVEHARRVGLGQR